MSDEHPPCIHCGEPALLTGECLNPDCSHYHPELAPADHLTVEDVKD